MDKSWLHRLIGMYAKWAKNPECETRSLDMSKWGQWEMNHIDSVCDANSS